MNMRFDIISPLLAVLCLLLFETAIAQDNQFQCGELMHSGSIAAAECPFDNNGIPCARIKVEILLPDVDISGSYIVKDVQHSIEKTTGGYQFWVSTGIGSEKQEITISHNDYYSTKFRLAYGGERLLPRQEYSITISIPQQGTAMFQTNGIKNCVIKVDDSPVTLLTGADGKSVGHFSVGQHSFVASANGCNTYTGVFGVTSSDEIVECTIELIPQDKHSEQYIQYRIKNIYKDDSQGYTQYATPEYQIIHKQYVESFSHNVKGGMEYKGHKWFRVDYNSSDVSSMDVEFVKLDSVDSNIANARISVRSEGYIRQNVLTLRYLSEYADWYVDDCIMEHIGSCKLNEQEYIKTSTLYNKF